MGERFRRARRAGRVDERSSRTYPQRLCLCGGKRAKGRHRRRQVTWRRRRHVPQEGRPRSVFDGPAEFFRKAVRLRGKLRVPVLQVNTETDVLALVTHLGFYAARQPDAPHLRTWEIAGAAHADNYLNGAAFVDTTTAPVEKLASAWAPIPATGGDPNKRMNNGPQA